MYAVLYKLQQCYNVCIVERHPTYVVDVLSFLNWHFVVEFLPSQCSLLPPL